MNVFGWALANWKLTGLIAGGLLLAGSVTVAYSQWKDRVQWEAVAAERLSDFQTADSAYSILANEMLVRDSLAREDSARIARLRAEAEAARQAAAENAAEASQRAVEAGRNLTETLDSIRVVMPVLGRVAQEQWQQIREAEDEEDRYQREQLDAQERVSETFREAARTWQDRFSAERELRVATERALDEARDALEARIEATEGTIYDHWTVQALALGAAAYAGYRFGVSR